MGIYVGDKRYAPYIGDKRRRYMGGGSAPLPYDAEVEYLVFANTQGIDTNIISDLSYTFELKVNISSITNGSENKNKIFTSRAGSADSQSRFFELEISSSDNYLRPRYNTDKDLTTYVVSLNTDMVISFNTSGQYIVNNEVVKTVTRVSNSTTKHLFVGCNSGIASNCGITGKYYYYRLYDGSTLILDFIPVRVGTDGYFYEKVSGELFKATNNTTFGVGPDKT